LPLNGLPRFETANDSKFRDAFGAQFILKFQQNCASRKLFQQKAASLKTAAFDRFFSWLGCKESFYGEQRPGSGNKNEPVFVVCLTRRRTE
jgi:hypothetical protein